MTLARERVRAFYDRLGSRYDWWRCFEEPATRDLVRHAAFEAAGTVFELGCGPGRLARRLLERHLPETARYQGVDLSPAMVLLLVPSP